MPQFDSSSSQSEASGTKPTDRYTEGMNMFMYGWINMHITRHISWPYLIVNFKLLDNTKFQKHPERSRDHGVVVQ